MRVAIVGAGSMGLLWAGRLQQAGCQVMLYTRTEEQALAIQRQGVTVRDTEGKSIARVGILAEAIAASMPQQASFAADWVLFMVKQHQLSEELLLQAKARCGSNARWICFQNGMGHLDKAAAVIGLQQLYAAVTTEAALRTSEDRVTHTGGGKTEWGKLVSSEMDSEEKKLAALWRKAGFPNDVSNDIDTAIWNKLLVNACINPLTAILRIRNGELLQRTHARSLMRELVDEACMLARALERPIDCEQAWEKLVQVCKATSHNRSSMLQDISRGHTTEIDAITGALLMEAEKQHLDLSAHRTVYRLVKALEGRE